MYRKGIKNARSKTTDIFLNNDVLLLTGEEQDHINRETMDYSEEYVHIRE